MLIATAHRAHRAQNAERHRQVEARAFFPDIRRRQINRDRLTRIAETGVHQRRFDTLPALAHGRIRHSHSNEIARISGIHIDFHIYDVRIDPKNSRTTGPKQGHVLGT